MLHREAARRLELSERQVERLVRAGALIKVHRGLVDERSVTLQQARVRRPGRGWDEATAWAAIAVLPERRAGWLGQTQRSRLKTTLKGLSAEDLVWRSRKSSRATAGPSSETERGTERPAKAAAALESLGYSLRPGVDPRNQRAHRFVRDGQSVDLVTSDIVDVVIADHAAPRVLRNLSLKGKTMVQVEGGTQALKRTRATRSGKRSRRPGDVMLWTCSTFCE